MTLYRLFNEVSKTQTLLLIAFILAVVPIMFLVVLNETAALALFHSAASLAVFQKQQLNAQAMLFLQIHDQGVMLANIFWGLRLFPFGVLVMRSGFFPRILGILLIAACFGYVTNSLILLLIPSGESIVNFVTSLSYIVGESGKD